MIDKKKAESMIHTLKSLRRLALNIHGIIDIVDDRNINEMITMLKEQPKVGEWIPCSERLPEGKVNPISNDYYEYPVTVDFNGTLDVRYYKFGDRHWWHGGKCMDDYVIAWIPRPEPWEGAEDDK